MLKDIDDRESSEKWDVSIQHIGLWAVSRLSKTDKVSKWENKTYQ